MNWPTIATEIAKVAKNNADQPADHDVDQAIDTSGWLSRSDVAARLKCSIGKIRKMEGSRLHPQRAAHGEWIFDPAEVDELSANLSTDSDGGALLQILSQVNTQLMKHLEATMDRANSGQAVVLKMLTDSVVSLSAKNESLTQDKLKTIATVEELMSDQAMRDLEQQREEQKQKLIGEAANKLFAMLPLIASKWIGSGPSAPAAANEVAKTLVKSITPDQNAKLFEILSPEQIALLMDLVQNNENETAAAGKIVKVE